MLNLTINPYICVRLIFKNMALSFRKIFLTSILTGVLMLPYLGSIFHLFEDHDHKTCEISETHLHELELDCDILDYQFAPSIEFNPEGFSALVQISKQKRFTSYYLGYSFSIDTIDTLRGPPIA
tara:strand:+ start:308 stop:679 length:372 start_codon:yes stop_codon:yes gene_type:complete